MKSMHALKPLMELLGYRFNQIKRLQQALTHRSAKKGKDHNERLELLGDAVLGLIITAELFERHPTASEGELSAMRSDLVCQQSLAHLANQLDIVRYIQLGKSERPHREKRRAALLADTLEAVIGAIYLDSDITQCRACVLAWYQDRLDYAQGHQPLKNPKSALQEYLQAINHTLADYQLIQQSGQSHDPRFTIRCSLTVADNQTICCEAVGKSRRDAEKKAAIQLLQLLYEKDYAASFQSCIDESMDNR